MDLLTGKKSQNNGKDKKSGTLLAAESTLKLPRGQVIAQKLFSEYFSLLTSDLGTGSVASQLAEPVEIWVLAFLLPGSWEELTILTFSSQRTIRQVVFLIAILHNVVVHHNSSFDGLDCIGVVLQDGVSQNPKSIGKDAERILNDATSPTQSAK